MSPKPIIDLPLPVSARARTVSARVAEALPKAKSLGEQVADHLRGSLRKRTWKHCLPPERQLCELAGVSRPVLRRAIHQLEQEGLVKTVVGHPTCIVRAPCGRHRDARRSLVVMLWSRSVATPFEFELVDEVRRILYDHGRRLECVVDRRLNHRHPDAVLRQLVEQHDADRWVLASLPASCLPWFHERRLGAVVLGHVPASLRLPSVDDDLDATARHAAGVLLGLGHRSILSILRNTGVAGELAIEEGLKRAFSARGNLQHRVVHHSGDLAELRRKLGQNLQEPRTPTAFFISHAMDTLVVISEMLERGIRVPGDVSVISLQGGGGLERITPAPARYVMDPKQHARYVCRLLEKPLLRGGRVRLFPTFIRGETLGPSPAPTKKGSNPRRGGT